ncbi:methyltransferase domain-containing protein [Kocuria sp. CPCC 205292]|uniref:methyltransferase domain-containing protein n=1 Tax=Kocuria cellulosilytica TaxID=3071451 RepID=UPI0034D67FA7
MGRDDFQLSVDAAEVYEAQFVPALFARWAPHTVRAGGVRPGQSVLDVACGTGVVAREAARLLQGSGRVVGLDVNAGMLAVARRVAPALEWVEADALDLPFPDGSFDVVLCQAGLMFVADPVRALQEMARVAAPEGTVAVQVWDELPAQTAWVPFYDVVERHAGPDAVDVIGSYWRLGDLAGLRDSLAAAGLRPVDTLTRTDTAAFPSVDGFVATEVGGTPLRSRLTDEAYARILEGARDALGPYRTGDGSLELPIRGHVVTARPEPRTSGRDPVGTPAAPVRRGGPAAG